MSDRIFRTLLKLLPAEFRGDYGREMEATFRAERRQAEGVLGVLRLWASTIADLFRTAPAEHVDILRRDLRYSLRMLARRPALALTAILTLALGIGANTAIFSVVHGVLLAPLPYPDPERLVMVQEDAADDDPGTTGYYSFAALRSQHATFDWLAAMGGWTATFTGEGQDPERVAGTRVSWEFFRLLGVQPALGRDFEQGEDQPARRRVVLLSDPLWRRRFKADPSIVGRVTTINGVDYLIAGVMPRTMNEIVSTRLLPGTEIWTLLGYATGLPQACPSCRHLQVVGRVKSGVDLRQAEADLTRIYQSISQQFPTDYAQPSAVLTRLSDHFLGPTREPLFLLWGAVGLLLLMTCANIANLLLIRASDREEEMAIRRAMGVTPVRLLRQLLTESALVATIGGAAGAAIAWWATSLLATHGPDAIPRLSEVTVNGTVLLYALGVSALTGIVFGMAPARMLIGRLGGAKASPLQGAPRGMRTTTGPTAWRYRATLIGVNVALSALLLVGSGLLVRSFLSLLTVEPGFNPHGVLTLAIDPSGQAYAENAGRKQYYESVMARLSANPGVASVGGSTQLPLTNSIDQWGITIEGRPLANPAESPEADRYGVSPGYFDTMQIPLLRGRLFTDADGTGAPPVVVLGKTMAEQLWPGEDPIGRRIRLAGGPNNPWRTIVGVVDDVRHYGLHLPATLQAYMPYGQAPWTEGSMTLLVRAKNGVDPLSLAASAREQVRAIDAQQPITALRTYDTIVADSMATRRFTLTLLATFAGTALVLAIVGLYGALSYVVSQRQREIGVRVALGAGTQDIRRLVVSQGMTPATIGLATGLLVAFAAGQAMQSMLFGVTATDAATFAIVPLLIGGSALAACLLPAGRAARIDPAVTLRAE